MKTIIIAEAGVNHNGKIDLAKKLIDIASNSGADYVKFQTFKSEKTVSKRSKKANYQKKEDDTSNSQLELLKNLELSYEDHHILIKYCIKKNIKFLSTAFDLDSLFFLSTLNIDFLKIPSGEITNLPYLEYASKLFNKFIISTGMASIDEIKNCINIFLKNKVDLKNITVLHCNTDYPTLMKDVNLKAMLDIKSKLKVDIGLSDHSLGIEVPVAAVALGARVIEKHFTISKEMAGPDHSASLDEIELTNMISSIRNVNIALSGTGLKNPTKSELKNKIYVRKSIHIKNNLKAGKKIVNDDLIMLRPGDGISPMKVNNFIGKVTSKNLKSGSKLKLTDLK